MMKVLVLSYNNCVNFGDRLGLDLIVRLQPPEAELFVSPLPPFWKQIDNASFDMVVVGTGHSVFHQTLERAFLEFLKKQKIVVGIFGLQYHQMLPLDSVKELFSIVDCWFSRSAYDIEFLQDLSSLPRQFAHLGDWLINAFPIVPWVDGRTCEVPADFIMQSRDIQRTIQTIQRFRRVSSARLHPVLCALASADEVRYQEQAEMGSTCLSGKFNSMFLDIFGKSPEPGEWFKVDRGDVSSYKSSVYLKTELMREYLWSALGSSLADRLSQKTAASFIQCLDSKPLQ